MKDYLVEGLAHIGIFTSDPDGCAEFYKNYLGFHDYYRYSNDHLTLTFVERGGCVIEFVSNEEARTNGIVDHIALQVQGIDAMVEELKAQGIVFEKEEIDAMPDFYPNGVRNIFFKGPAGERIELFDYSR